MKKLLLGLLLITTASTSIANVSPCTAWNVHYSDAEQAIRNFVKEKLNASDDYIYIDFTEVSNFTSRKDIGATLISAPSLIAGLFDGKKKFDEYRDIKGCNNLKFITHVNYTTEDDLDCTVNLKVKMYGDIYNHGFKSVVKQKYKPVCEEY